LVVLIYWIFDLQADGDFVISIMFHLALFEDVIPAVDFDIFSEEKRALKMCSLYTLEAVDNFKRISLSYIICR